MSIYCIGDLHGRFDLFSMILEKIKFDHKKDTLYLLGDAIDGAYGGIQIIRYMMKHKESCVFIRGNHETFFLDTIPEYDIIMADTELKQAIVEIENHPTIFEELKKICKGDLNLVVTDKVSKWAQNGNIKRRETLLGALKVFTKINGYSINNFNRLFCNKLFKTREFIKELVQLNCDEYSELKMYLSNCPKTISLDVNNRHFELMHSIRDINKRYYNWQIFKQMQTTDTYYIYGHIPVPKLYNKINGIEFELIKLSHLFEKRFDFDYRKIFSYVDTNNNYYYNLDIASNPVAALKLDDMSEYYVGIPSSKKDSSYQKVPDDVIEYNPTHYEKYNHPITIGKYSFKRHTKSRFVIVTFKGHSYEYLIAVDKINEKIYYTRISWMNLRFIPYFIINNFNISQSSIEDIIEIVSKQSKIDSAEIPEEYLYGFNLE